MYRKSERSKRPTFLLFGYPVINNHSCLAYMNGATIKFIKAFKVAQLQYLCSSPSQSSLREGNRSCLVNCSILAISIASISIMLSTLSKN